MMCSDDCMARSQKMYNDLHAEIDRLQELVTEYNTLASSLQSELLSEREMYQTAVRTIMEQAREIRALKSDIEGLSNILAEKGI